MAGRAAAGLGQLLGDALEGGLYVAHLVRALEGVERQAAVDQVAERLRGSHVDLTHRLELKLAERLLNLGYFDRFRCEVWLEVE